ncbi:unnamed protein product [Diplocarpon coronariae]
MRELVKHEIDDAQESDDDLVNALSFIDLLVPFSLRRLNILASNKTITLSFLSRFSRDTMSKTEAVRPKAKDQQGYERGSSSRIEITKSSSKVTKRAGSMENAADSISNPASTREAPQRVLGSPRTLRHMISRQTCNKNGSSAMPSERNYIQKDYETKGGQYYQCPLTPSKNHAPARISTTRSIGDTSAQDDAVQPRKAANSRSRIIANTNSQTHAYGNSVVPPNAFNTAPVPGDPFYYNPDLRDSDTSVGIDSDYLTSVVDHTRNHPTMEHGILANNRLDAIGPSFLCLAASSH